MGVTTHDIFGSAAGEPATPGSYGFPPKGHRLPDGLALGGVRLQVSDLARSADYYQSTLGLTLIDKSAGTAKLAPKGTTESLVELVEKRGASPAPRRGRLGLFHFAILLPDRPSLGRFVKHLGAIGARAGAGDHLVSEAFYLQDPDNLGIEVYADRPRDTWRRQGRELMMATDPVDVPGLVAAAGDSTWDGMPAGTHMGHLHLHVGELDRARAFYSEGLGLDVMSDAYPGALFMSAGGYHHHLANNLWAGAGATPAGPEEAQLLEWTMKFPAGGALGATLDSLGRWGFTGERQEETVVIKDPWGQALRLTNG